MTDEQITNIANKLADVGRQDLAMKFIHAEDKYGVLRNEIGPELEANDTKFADKYGNIEDLIGDRNTRLAKLFQKTKGQMPAKARLVSFLNNNPDISEQDVKNWFNKTNEYKEYYKKLQEDEAGRTRRRQQIEGTYSRDPSKNWDLVDKALASDYEKQRYIDDPKSAIFGDEASGFIGSSAGAKADLISGAAAAAADIGTAFVPGGKIANVLAGPAIRAGRDAAHVYFDSPYQKSREQIAADFLTDAALNAPAAYLANAKRGKRMADVQNDVKTNTYRMYKQTNNINEGISKVERNFGKGLNNSEWNNLIETLPESPLKQDLKFASKQVQEIGGDMGDVADDVITTYKGIADPSIQAKALSEYNKGRPLISEDIKLIQNDVTPNANKYFTESVLAPKPTQIQKLGYKAGDFIGKYNVGPIGAAGVETTKTVVNARPGRPSRVQTAIERAQFEQAKQEYKNTESRFWEAGFKPHKVDGDPLWEAYKEWYKEVNGEDVK